MLWSDTIASVKSWCRLARTLWRMRKARNELAWEKALSEFLNDTTATQAVLESRYGKFGRSNLLKVDWYVARGEFTEARALLANSDRLISLACAANQLTEEKRCSIPIRFGSYVVIAQIQPSAFGPLIRVYLHSHDEGEKVRSIHRTFPFFHDPSGQIIAGLICSLVEREDSQIVELATKMLSEQ